MSKVGKEILQGAREALAYAEGTREGYVVHVPSNVDVKAIRQKLDLTRDEFAMRFGFSPDAVKEWEMKRRQPDRSARVLLKVIEHDPEAVTRALSVA